MTLYKDPSNILESKLKQYGVTLFGGLGDAKGENKSADNIVIACSGGPDSMYLLWGALMSVPHENIVVAHFNHKLRGKESDNEEKFVKEYCKNNNLIFERASADIEKLAKENKMGIEEMARTSRYEFLESVRIKHQAKYILTAHHLDDSIETMLFNLVRGSSLVGVSGIKELNGTILRPFVKEVTKSEIEHYLKSNEFEYKLDSSNKDTSYIRNKIRIDILPQFESINPNYRKSLAQFISSASDASDFIKEKTSEFVGDKDYIDVLEFKKQSDYFKKEILYFIFKKVNGNTVGISEGNLTDMVKMIESKGNKTVKIIKSLKLFKDNKKIYFSKV